MIGILDPAELGLDGPGDPTTSDSGYISRVQPEDIVKGEEHDRDARRHGALRDSTRSCWLDHEDRDERRDRNHPDDVPDASYTM